MNVKLLSLKTDFFFFAITWLLSNRFPATFLVRDKQDRILSDYYESCSAYMDRRKPLYIDHAYHSMVSISSSWLGCHIVESYYLPTERSNENI